MNNLDRILLSICALCLICIAQRIGAVPDWFSITLGVLTVLVLAESYGDRLRARRQKEKQ